MQCFFYAWIQEIATKDNPAEVERITNLQENIFITSGDIRRACGLFVFQLKEKNKYFLYSIKL